MSTVNFAVNNCSSGCCIPFLCLYTGTVSAARSGSRTSVVLSVGGDRFTNLDCRQCCGRLGVNGGSDRGTGETEQGV